MSREEKIEELVKLIFNISELVRKGVIHPKYCNDMYEAIYAEHKEDEEFTKQLKSRVREEQLRRN